MSSRLGTFARRWTDPNTQGSRAKLIAQEAEPIQISPPFGGYIPDLSKSLMGWGDAKVCVGLIERSGVLEVSDGYYRVDSTRLPLGDSTPPAATGKPVCGLFESFNTSLKIPVRLAMVSGTNDTSDPGRLYHWKHTDSQWEHIPDNTLGTDVLSGHATAPEKILFDACFYATAASGWCIFTNNIDPIMRFQSGGPVYDLFDSSSAYIAKSVEASEDRVLALNTSVGGTRKLTKLIWTNKSATPSFSQANAGAGDADFDEVKGQGLKVMNLGRLIALYFDTAVVVLSRTGILVDPFRKFYSSHDRGLLSTHSVVNVESGRHFGLFTDGWFFFDESGTWTEAGVRSSNSGAFHKWRNTFYEQLEWENRDRVVCGYDPINRHVKIAFPSVGNSTPDTVWNYDIMGDRVWPDDYAGNAPNIWGLFQREATTGETWNTITDLWSTSSKEWDGLESTKGRQSVVHGTVDGLVFLQSPQILTKDGTLSTYLYRSPQLGRGYDIHTARKLVVGYRRLIGNTGADPPSIACQLTSNAGQSQTRQVPQTEGASGTHQSGFVSGLVSGSEIGWSVEGTAPVAITNLQLHITVHGNAPVRVEGQ